MDKKVIYFIKKKKKKPQSSDGKTCTRMHLSQILRPKELTFTNSRVIKTYESNLTIGQQFIHNVENIYYVLSEM